LRQLESDLVRFADYYTKFFAEQCGRKLDGIAPEASALIRSYSWPGNLRELRNAIERAVILAKEQHIMPNDLPIELRRQVQPEGDGAENVPVAGSLISLDQLEEAHLKKILQRTPSLTEAAQILGIDQATLYRKRKKIGI
jgi:two-component system, NtrC family, response regulator AlgB